MDKKANSLRLFTAILLPERIRTSLSGLQRMIGRRLTITLRKVPSENLHVTLRFLGSVDQSAVPEVISEMTASACHSFMVLFDKIEFIKRGKNGGIILARIAIRNELLGLAGSDIYAPHVTLFRIKNVKKWSLVRKMMDSMPHLSLSFIATSVSLMESKLTAEGSHYTERIRVGFW